MLGARGSNYSIGGRRMLGAPESQHGRYEVVAPVTPDDAKPNQFAPVTPIDAHLARDQVAPVTPDAQVAPHAKRPCLLRKIMAELEEGEDPDESLVEMAKRLESQLTGFLRIKARERVEKACEEGAMCVICGKSARQPRQSTETVKVHAFSSLAPRTSEQWL